MKKLFVMAVIAMLQFSSCRTAKNVVVKPVVETSGSSIAGHELATQLLNVSRGRSMTLPNNNTSYTSSSSYSQDFVETVLDLNMKMVYVEGGNFLMGTVEQGSDGEDDEQVIRRVRLDSYYIGECEVTQAQWEIIMGSSVNLQRDREDRMLPLAGVGSDYPMYYVSWEEAMEFCRELSRMTGRTYTLPTEAQWEYAARGGKKADGTKYSGGPIDAVAWYIGNCALDTHPVRIIGAHPVKSKRANGLGLYDMSGNVNEWCSDWYSNNYNVNDTNNPTGPSSGSSRVRRGGWLDNAHCCRVSERGGTPPCARSCTIGFRVVVIP